MAAPNIRGMCPFALPVPTALQICRNCCITRFGLFKTSAQKLPHSKVCILELKFLDGRLQQDFNCVFQPSFNSKFSN